MGEINNSSESRSYSRVYKLLVHGEDDLAGQIAYSIYKNHKIDKITRFAAQNKRLPNNEELSAFMENAESENQLRFYNDRAMLILKKFLDETIADEVEKTRSKLKVKFDAEA